MRRGTFVLWSLACLATGFFVVGPATAAPAPCADGGSISAYVNKGPVHVGERVVASAEVSTNAVHGKFPATCRLTEVRAQIDYGDGTMTTFNNGISIRAGGHHHYFNDRTTVTAGDITQDPQYGPLFRITVGAIARCGSSTFDGYASYAVGADGSTFRSGRVTIQLVRE